ncbi:hypothetical protein DFH07DRAFT_840254 [Mycena maculata]|uniref:Uncharacterized protein n=1 Tax=Mycena maculata TaxID=230809 RepID=A0AAD7ICK4_9AGAR|nr:hypothetical protein DFH07DRAFT_840254 [Mycena maculata]
MYLLRYRLILFSVTIGSTFAAPLSALLASTCRPVTSTSAHVPKFLPPLLPMPSRGWILFMTTQIVVGVRRRRRRSLRSHPSPPLILLKFSETFFLDTILRVRASLYFMRIYPP